jgi:hypothetical protein
MSALIAEDEPGSEECICAQTLEQPQLTQHGDPGLAFDPETVTLQAKFRGTLIDLDFYARSVAA